MDNSYVKPYWIVRMNNDQRYQSFYNTEHLMTRLEVQNE